MNFQARIQNYINASFAALAVQTTEESRAMRDILAVAAATKRPVYLWSCTEGLKAYTFNAKGEQTLLQSYQELEMLEPCLAHLCTMAEAAQAEIAAAARMKPPREPVFNPKTHLASALIVLRDPHLFPLDGDPTLPRRFRDLFNLAPAVGAPVIILAPEYTPHPTFARAVTVLDYSLPNPSDLREICEQVRASALESGVPEKDVEITDELVRALGGLSTAEAANALALCTVEECRFDSAIVYREKVLAVKRSGLLEIIEPDPRGLDAIGGFDLMKPWIQRRRDMFSDEAREFGLPDPKGVLMLGVPGSGKSLAAKTFGTALRCPVLRFDIGKMFGSLMGESERQIREALELAEAVSPCILWLDEIDKGFSGTQSSGQTDGGTTSRVFGTFITWMQERKRPVFVVATANNVSQLPPELLRKGRFDEIFFVDLPTLRDRQEILAIQLKKYGRNPEDFDLASVANVTSQFTGSELESVVVEALVAAFDDGRRKVSDLDLIRAAEATVPLATTATEVIAALRDWSRKRARPASSPEVEPDTVTSGVGGGGRKIYA